MNEEPANNQSAGTPSDTSVVKKSWFARHKVLTGIGVVVLLSLIVNGLSGTDDVEKAPVAQVSESPSPRATETTTSEPEPEVSATPTPMATVAQATEQAPPPPPPPPAESYGPRPADQQAFLDTFEAGKAAYEAAGTELQRSVALTDRDAQMCAVSGQGSMTNWTGKILEIGANNDGLAHVKIELSEGVKVQTWNNAFSDLTDNTLIPQNAPFFSTLAGMSEGTLVTFAAQTVPSPSSCLTRSNLTDVFYAIDPNFIVRFSDIRPL
ncbi:hypothetical protein [Arthrobacter koreensis]|uniref:hypothetical protein n=1 Tax=Arthrobacter koreensis TaxID=199136 RepID=UPI00186AE219|nr:hypothetical protein [Arthrobacter koreensis]